MARSRPRRWGSRPSTSTAPGPAGIVVVTAGPVSAAAGRLDDQLAGGQVGPGQLGAAPARGRTPAGPGRMLVDASGALPQSSGDGERRCAVSLDGVDDDEPRRCAAAHEDA